VVGKAVKDDYRDTEKAIEKEATEHPVNRKVA
jgi:hypothetical protein